MSRLTNIVSFEKIAAGIKTITMAKFIFNNVYIFLTFAAILVFLSYLVYRKTEKHFKKYLKYDQVKNAVNKQVKVLKVKRRIKIMLQIILGISGLLFFYYGGKYNILDMGWEGYFVFSGLMLSILITLLAVLVETMFLVKFFCPGDGAPQKTIDEKQKYVVKTYVIAIFKASVSGMTILSLLPFILYPSWFTFGIIFGPVIIVLEFIGELSKLKFQQIKNESSHS